MDLFLRYGEYSVALFKGDVTDEHRKNLVEESVGHFGERPQYGVLNAAMHACESSIILNNKNEDEMLQMIESEYAKSYDDPSENDYELWRPFVETVIKIAPHKSYAVDCCKDVVNSLKGREGTTIYNGAILAVVEYIARRMLTIECADFITPLMEYCNTVNRDTGDVRRWCATIERLLSQKDMYIK